MVTTGTGRSCRGGWLRRSLRSSPERWPGAPSAESRPRDARSFWRSDAMKIGVPREIKANEHRVGLAPTSVRELARGCASVLVETSAGAGVGFSDDQYRA